jgi:hypothetical protein
MLDTLNITSYYAYAVRCDEARKTFSLLSILKFKCRHLSTSIATNNRSLSIMIADLWSSMESITALSLSQSM